MLFLGVSLLSGKLQKKKKGEDHERVEKKAIGHPIAVKKKKGSRMVMSKRGQQRQVWVKGEKRKGDIRKTLRKARGSFVFFLLLR
jgi:hypothetical protein